MGTCMTTAEIVASRRRLHFRLSARDLENAFAKVVIPRLGGDGFVTLYTQLSNTWVALGLHSC
jgi:hypothetical protein